MGNIAIYDLKQQKANGRKSTSASFRNFVELEKNLGADLFVEDYVYDKEYDSIIFGYGSISSDINTAVRLINNNPDAKLFFFCTEYEQQTHPGLWTSGRSYEVIKNFEGNGKLAGIKNGRVTKTHTLNLNLLLSSDPNPLIEKKYDLIYYTRYRKDRRRYQVEYCKPPLILSTSKKNAKKFINDGVEARIIDKISWKAGRETLNLFRFSLYLEDEYTHTNFNNLANRWYEAGICNNIMLFDVNCINTIRKSEIAPFWYEVQDYIVSSHSDMVDKIEQMRGNFEHHLNIQKSWRENTRAMKLELIDDLRRILLQSNDTCRNLS